jgi:cytochrome c-type biogenesis protein CcmF
LEKFPERNQLVSKPAVRSTTATDVMLALLKLPENPGDPVSLRIIVQPMVAWLWLGGAVMAAGTVLALVPTNLLRRPTDPVSAPVGPARRLRPAADAAEAVDGDGDGAPSEPEPTDEPVVVS